MESRRICEDMGSTPVSAKNKYSEVISVFICTECGLVFENPKQCYGGWLEHFGTKCREIWLGCPDCEETYEDAFECIKCGDYVSEDCTEMVLGEILCIDCNEGEA